MREAFGCAEGTRKGLPGRMDSRGLTLKLDVNIPVRFADSFATVRCRITKELRCGLENLSSLPLAYG